ncbi:MAG: CinA family protein [Ehrlichia sp.]
MIIKQETLELAKTCVTNLIERNFRIVIAESCTGGLMSFFVLLYTGSIESVGLWFCCLFE